VTPGGRILIEVAVESPADAVAAEAGGADRLELCAALDLGGLTPTLGTYLEVRAACRLPVVVMVRPRPGDFVYTESEARVMARDIELFLPHKPDGFVFGPLTADARVDVSVAGPLVKAAAGTACVFHRAFDRIWEPLDALEVIAELGFRRILTSGGSDTAVGGVNRIAEVRKRAARTVDVLPCGRVRAENAVVVVKESGCRQVHGSFAEPVPEGTGRGYRGYTQRSRTSRESVAACRAVLTDYALGRLD
jgi:copper homeostasis protein